MSCATAASLPNLLLVVAEADAGLAVNTRSLFCCVCVALLHVILRCEPTHFVYFSTTALFVPSAHAERFAPCVLLVDTPVCFHTFPNCSRYSFLGNSFSHLHFRLTFRSRSCNCLLQSGVGSGGPEADAEARRAGHSGYVHRALRECSLAVTRLRPEQVCALCLSCVSVVCCAIVLCPVVA